MTTNEVLMLLTGIAVSCAVFALLFIIYPRLKPAGGKIVQAAVEAELQPLIYEAIMAAYRLSEKSIDQGHARLRGSDKKFLADDVYAFLPERVGQHDITFVKSLVPRERFQALVQNAFDQFDRFYLLNHAHFDDEFQKWAEKHKPAPADGATAARTQ
jgi:hypothetical protein